jgi:signal peptidase I
LPSYRTARVAEITVERRGLQRVVLDDGSRAYVLTQLTGPVAVADPVIVNTTAVDLALGTGGWHVVHWNLARDEWSEHGPGHIMKMRYTSLQADTGAAEEHGPPTITELSATPVIACALHSQLAPVAVAFRAAAPGKRLVYVMTDGGALPLAISDLVHDLTARGLIAATVTAGQAFGGDREAVTLHSALLIAKDIEHADAIVAGIGPGVVGTGTTYGHTGLDVVAILNAATALRGTPIVAVRYSGADTRDRHHGRSHHTTTALDLAAGDFVVPSPDDVDVPDVGALLEQHDLRVTSMGRGPSEDPAFFRWAAAAGVAAARLVGDGNVGAAVTSIDDDRDNVVPAEGPSTDEGGPSDRSPSSRGRRAVRWLTEWAIIIAVALLAVVVLRAFFVQTFYIPSASMDPTLRVNDRILVNKLSYRLHDINRGDVVVFTRPECDQSDPQVKDLVKRVVGLPGETWEARNGSVYIDGRRLREPYLPDGVTTTDHEPVEVPEGHIGVMGVNRSNSKDSRSLCNAAPTPIDTDDVVGRAFVRVWPIGELKTL